MVVKFIKWLGIGLLICIVAAALYFKALTSGWLTEKRSPSELEIMLVPHMQVYKPDGQQTFATILMFHGCGGDREQQQAWAETFRDWGYAAVTVDSYAGRGIDYKRAISHVCQGRQLIGAERAGDVLTALSWARQQSWVDQNRLIVMGWSHGAWSVMDAFALDAKDQLPHGLESKPSGTVADIDQLVLFYPYCGLGTKTTKDGWRNTPSTLAITVEVDTVVGSGVCKEKFQTLAKVAPAFQHDILKDVDHAFDVDAVTTQRGWEYRTPKDKALAATERAKKLLQDFLVTP